MLTLSSRKPKVAFIGTNGIPANYGGFETLVENVAPHFLKDYDVFVYCSSVGKRECRDEHNGIKLKYIPLKANGWQSVLYDGLGIIDSFRCHDIIVLLGFSGAVVLPLNVFFNRCVVSNVGGIEADKVRGLSLFSSFEKGFKNLLEFFVVRFSDAIIVDNGAIGERIKCKYGVVADVIEYGGDHAYHCPRDTVFEASIGGLFDKYDLVVSRAQVDMNIHVVLEAYSQNPSRNLIVVSNWATSEYGRSLHSKFSSAYSNIKCVEAIYDQRKLNSIRSNCDFYVHPHSLCGTAPSLVEAMYLGLPVLAFDVGANRFATRNEAFYFNSAADLVQKISGIDEESRLKCGANMKRTAHEAYRWGRISEKYLRVIEIVAVKCD